MKILLSIIIGVIVGIGASALMITANQPQVAYGSITLWDEAVAYGDLFDWSDVFMTPSGPQGQGLYKLIYSKLLVVPEKDALKEVAQKFGLTKDEAQRVVNGSITPLFHTENRRSVALTQETAFVLYNNLQEDFEDLSEIFELEQELDVALQPSEMFSNGNLNDSGFDLVHDLTIIEEILFVDAVENTVGDPYPQELASPYVVPRESESPEVAGVDETDDLKASDVPFGTADAADLEDGTVYTNEEGETVITVGGNEIEVELLEGDVCKVDTTIADALDSFSPSGPDAESSVNTGDPSATPDASSESGTESGADAGEAESVEAPVVNPDGSVNPAPSDTWGSPWCPSVSDVVENGTGAFAGSNFGGAGFESLGGFVDSTIKRAAAVGAGIDTAGFSAQISLCLETNMVFKRVSSYKPGTSCIACEIDRINDIMKETLYHSLIPNKVTGNIFESAKCKQSYEPLVDFKVIFLGAPIPAAANDNLIFEEGLFEQWNDFVDRYEPFLGLKPQYSEDWLTKYELASLPKNRTTTDLLNGVNNIRFRQTAEAEQGVSEFQIGNDGTNTMLYSQVLLGELKQMTAFFEHFNELYLKIDTDACVSIKEKPNID